MSEEQREITSEEHGSEMCWDVETDHYGFGEPIKFQIIDRYYSSKFGVSNSLIDTASKEIKDRIRTLFEPSGELAYYVIDDDGDYEFFSYPLRGRDSFYQAYEEVQEFQKFLSNYPNLEDETFVLDYYIPDEKDGKSVAASYMNTKSYDLRISTNYPAKEDYDRIIREGSNDEVRGSLSKYLERSLELGLLDRIDEFSQEEIDWCIEDSHSNGSRGITKVKDKDMKVLDERVVYGWYNGSISYGNIYRLSKSLGLEVTGDWWAFSVVGKDGQVYKFSYEGVDSGDGASAQAEELSPMLGVELDDGQPIYEVVFDKEKLVLLKMTPGELREYILENTQLTQEDVVVERDSVILRAKQKQVSGVIEANEAKMADIGAELEKIDSEFFYNQTNVYKDLRIRVEGEKSEILKNHQEKVDKLLALGYLNRILVDLEVSSNPEYSSPIWVEIYYTVRNGYDWKDHTIKRYEYPSQEGGEG